MSRQHEIVLGGLVLVPDLSGALFLKDESTLLVADLHLEQGASLARRGIHVPPYDTLQTLDQLDAVLAATGARRLVLLGDSFHDRVAHHEIDENHVQRLSAITGAVETIWISGNHDPLPHQHLGGQCADELSMGAVMLRHIPAALPAGAFEIAGHLHPGAGIVQRGHRVQGKCFVSDGQRLVMPAFGSYTGGLNVRSRAFEGLFDAAQTHVWMIGASAIHKFPLSRTG